MFGWPWIKKPVVISQATAKSIIFKSSGHRYSKVDLEEVLYVLVPDRDWILRNCPSSKKPTELWDCTKIAVAAVAKLQTRACGCVKVDWIPEDKTHMLVLVIYEDKTVELFDPHTRLFYSADGRTFYKLWM